MGFWRWLWVRATLPFRNGDIITKAVNVLKQLVIVILLSLILITLLPIVKALLLSAIDRHYIVYCNELKEQSATGFIGFYITPEDKTTCDALHVEIVAPVGAPYEKEI
jgi:hypothetical protein